jgi:hypothetical protein
MADDPKTGQPDDGNRRGFLRSAAVATAAVAAAGTASGQEPDEESQGVRRGRLPLNTPITQFGFNAAELAMLSPAAKKLTKADMLQLQEWAAKGDVQDAPVHLTISDMNSLRAAYNAMETRQHAGGMLQSSGCVSCCCCTPCCSCCAAAESA